MRPWRVIAAFAVIESLIIGVMLYLALGTTFEPGPVRIIFAVLAVHFIALAFVSSIFWMAIIAGKGKHKK